VILALAAAAVIQPHVVWRPIPYGPKRRAEMAHYSALHYGVHSSVLRPRVIVEHYTANESFSATWNTFAADTPDPDLGQLPGTCAHFVVDKDGTIYQLVRLDVICRHTVGLNDVAIGIEHVGNSDSEILRDAAQIRSSLLLTRWLMAKFHITLKNVIGHNESLSSPFHKELYRPWAHQTHGDWNHADMTVYRARRAATR